MHGGVGNLDYNKSRESIYCRTKIYRAKLTVTSNYLSSLLHMFSHPTITHDVLPHSHELDQRTGLLLLLFRFATALSSLSLLFTKYHHQNHSFYIFLRSQTISLLGQSLYSHQFVFLLSPEPQLPNLPLSSPRSPRGLGII